MPIIWTTSGTPFYLIKLPKLFIGNYTNSPPKSNACRQNLSHMWSLSSQQNRHIHQTEKVDKPTRRLNRSHKAAEEGESTRARPVSTAYSPIIRRSGPTEEDGQPLPTVAHAEWRGLLTRVNGAVCRTARSANRGRDLAASYISGHGA